MAQAATKQENEVVQQVSLTPLKLLTIGQIAYSRRSHWKVKVIRQTEDSTTIEVLDKLPSNVSRIYTRGNDELFLAEPKDLDEALDEVIKKDKIVMVQTTENISVVNEQSKKSIRRPKGVVNKEKENIVNVEIISDEEFLKELEANKPKEEIVEEKEVMNTAVGFIDDVPMKVAKVAKKVKEVVLVDGQPRKRGRPVGSTNKTTQLKAAVQNYTPKRRGRKPKVAESIIEDINSAPVFIEPEIIEKPKKLIRNKLMEERNLTEGIEMLTYIVDFLKKDEKFPRKSIEEITMYLHKVYPQKHCAILQNEMRSIFEIDGGEYIIKEENKYSLKK